MKKLALTIAIVLGMGLCSFADGHQGGMFQRGAIDSKNNNYMGYFESTRNEYGAPNLPSHGLSGNQDAPLGTGIALLLGLGGAYLVAKKRREE